MLEGMGRGCIYRPGVGYSVVRVEVARVSWVGQGRAGGPVCRVQLWSHRNLISSQRQHVMSEAFPSLERKTGEDSIVHLLHRSHCIT